MRESGEQQHGAFVAFQRIAHRNASRHIDNIHRMDANVAFGMPLGVLRNGDQICNFREVNHPSGGDQIFGDAAGI